MIPQCQCFQQNDGGLGCNSVLNDVQMSSMFAEGVQALIKTSLCGVALMRLLSLVDLMPALPLTIDQLPVGYLSSASAMIANGNSPEQRRMVIPEQAVTARL